MKLLGLDFGTKRIGVALSDGPGWSARGVTTIQRKGGVRDLDAVSRLVQEHEVDELVMGLPLNMDGSEGRMVQLTKRFAEQLRERLDMTVHLFDERLSSFEAESVLAKSTVKRGKRKGLVDQVAAAIILQSFLEAQEAQAETEGEGQ